MHAHAVMAESLGSRTISAIFQFSRTENKWPIKAICFYITFLL